MKPEVEVADVPQREVIVEAELLADAEAEAKAFELSAQVEEEVKRRMKEVSAADPTATAMLQIAQSMQAFMERGEATRQRQVHEISPVTPWNPEGKRQRVGFSRPTFQHGIPLDPLTCTEETIRLFNQLKPGRYLGRKIEVQLAQDGAINLQWAGQRIDQRIEFYSKFGHIDDVLRAVLAERTLKEEAKRTGQIEDSEYLP